MTLHFQVKRSTLPNALIAKGMVTKRLVYCSDDTEVAILELTPGAEIAWHDHTSNSELHFLIATGSGELCQIGSSHHYKNDSSHPVQLLSVKSTKKMEIVVEDGNVYVRGD